MIFALAAIVGLASAPTALAWGYKVHNMIGMIAQEFLTEDAKIYVEAVLEKDETLASVAPWADKVRRTKEYSYSRGYHFVNVNDDPPTSCGYDDDRDCDHGNCIVRAIADYTALAVCDADVEHQERYDSLKFLVHLVGEMTQPMHVSERQRGGNLARITFANRKNNLHSIWDTAMPMKRVAEDFGGSQDAYVKFLVNKIKRGAYKSGAATQWVSAHGLADRNHNENSLAAIDWAIDSDALDCSVVWPGHDADPDQDFAGSYYTTVVPTVDLQIAKGGYRLANWINRIAATC